MFEKEAGPPRIVSLNQPLSKATFDYWNALRNGRIFPKRREIDPAHIRALLPHVLMLERRMGNDAFIRLAGTAICAAFGRELRAQDFLTLWANPSRLTLHDALARSSTSGYVLALTVRANILSRKPIAAEILLCPVLDDENRVSRIFGSFALERSSHRPKPIAQLELMAIRAIAPDQDVTELQGKSQAMPSSIALNVISATPRHADETSARAPTLNRPWARLFEAFKGPSS